MTAGGSCGVTYSYIIGTLNNKLRPQKDDQKDDLIHKMQRSAWFSSLYWRRIGLAGIRFSTEPLKKTDITLPRALPSNVYETDKFINQYMAFHYAEKEKYFKYDFGPKDHLEFPLRCAKLCIKHIAVRILLVSAWIVYYPYGEYTIHGLGGN